MNHEIKGTLCADPIVTNLEQLAEVADRDLYCKDSKGQWMRPYTRGLGFERYCTTCNIWRPPRASHCSKCGYCIVRPALIWDTIILSAIYDICMYIYIRV